MSDPTVLLIGGPPGAGKTTLARAVAAELGWASTTGDDLAIAVRAVTDPVSHPELHPMPGGDHRAYFTEGPPERLLADAMALASTMWPVVERVVRSHLASAAPLVLDWWLLSPTQVASSGLPVASAWLHVDPRVLDGRERSLVSFREGSVDPERMHANFMARSLWRNDLVVREATAADLPVIHQDGTRSVPDLVAEVLRSIG